MSMIRVAGHVVVQPRPFGVQTKLPYSRDWRFDRRWNMWYTEVIPLSEKQGGTAEHFAIAPAGDKSPLDTQPSEWDASAAGNYSRIVEVGGQAGARWFQFDDGAVRTAGTGQASELTVATNNPPNWSLHLIRQSPPAGQTAAAAIAVEQHCHWYDGTTWQTGHLTLYIPHSVAQITAPLWHITYGEPGAGGILTYGRIWGVLESDKKDAIAEDKQDWACEYLPHPDGVRGGWWIISCNGKIWDFHDERVCLASGGSAIAVTCGGAPITWNLSGIAYGNYVEIIDDVPATVPARAWSQYGYPNPACAGSEWLLEPTWRGIASVPTGWTATAEGTRGNTWKPYPTWVWDTVANAPLLTFTRSSVAYSNVRPVAWFCAEDHEAVFGAIDQSIEMSADSVEDLEVSRNADWKKGTASAQFAPTATPPHTSWREGNLVGIYLGWQTGAGTYAEKLIARQYIAPGGLPTEADGAKANGFPSLSLQTEDLSEHMGRNEIVDASQAGGRTFGSWARSVGAFNGLPASEVYVDPAFESRIIPYAALPCAEAFAPQGNWVQHCDEVCRAMGTRWGCDAVFGGTRYSLFFGVPFPRYISGVTPELVIDGTNVGATHVSSLHVAGAAQKGPTAFRIEYGPQDNRQVGYMVEPTASRIASGGRVQWRNLSIGPEGDATALADLARDYWNGKRRMITVRTLLRTDIEPDQFIGIAVATYRDAPQWSVWKIETAHYRGGGMESEFTAALVYLSSSMSPATGGSALGSGGYS